jgi:hypothetical protein
MKTTPQTVYLVILVSLGIVFSLTYGAIGAIVSIVAIIGALGMKYVGKILLVATVALPLSVGAQSLPPPAPTSPPPEQEYFILQAIGIGVLVGGCVWIGIKAVDRVLDIELRRITNNIGELLITQPATNAVEILMPSGTLEYSADLVNWEPWVLAMEPVRVRIYADRPTGYWRMKSVLVE